MKKLVAITVLFALLTGAAFAEVTLSGGVETGLKMQFGSSFDGNELFTIGNFDDSVRLNLNGAFTHSSGNAGGNFQLRARYTGWTAGATDGAQAFAFQNRAAWLWFKPLDMLRIHIGRLDGDSMGTGSRIDASNDVGGGTGIHFRLEPMDGLRVGLTINPDGTFKAMDLRFGLVYTMANTFRAAANLAVANLGADAFGGINMAFGVQILALKDVGFSVISVDASLGSVGKENTDPSIAIGQRLTFATGDLTITEELRVDLNQGTDNDMAMRVNLTGAYKIDTVTAGIGFGLGVNRASGTDPRSWDGTGGAFTKDAMVLVVNPYVTFPLGGPNFTVGYGINIGLPKDGDAVINNTIYATTSISF